MGDIATICKDLKLYMEWSICVDKETTFAIAELVVNAVSCPTRSIAVGVVALRVWGVAFVGSGGEGVLVGFHDFEFWAVLRKAHSSIAVEVAVRDIELALLVLSGHGHSVECI